MASPQKTCPWCGLAMKYIADSPNGYPIFLCPAPCYLVLKA